MKHFNTGRSTRAAACATLASIVTSIIAIAVAWGGDAGRAAGSGDSAVG